MRNQRSFILEFKRQVVFEEALLNQANTGTLRQTLLTLPAQS